MAEWTADEAQQVAVKSRSRYFGGIAIDRAAGAADVYVVEGGGAFATQIRDLGPEARIKWVKRSYAELTAIRDRIAADSTWLRSIGIELVSWGPEVHTNTVRVGVRTASEEHVRAIKARYGDHIDVFADDGEIAPAVGRWDDVQPWNAGNTIVRPHPNGPGNDTPTCTTGPTVRNPASGNAYSITAAHCQEQATFATTDWWNGPPYSWPVPARYVGRVAYADYAPNSTDSALIYSNASAYVWRYGTTRARQVSSSPLGQSINDRVCVSGSLSGEICDAVLVAVNWCFPSGGGSVCNADVAQRDGVAVAGNGDSGGPVYNVRTGGVNVRGMIDAIYLGDHEVPCLYWQRPLRRCSQKVVYVEIARLLTQWGAVLKTS